MHAYGKRYQDENADKSPPRLGLIYPMNPNFQEKLFQMRYGQDLLLDVIPFDFGNINPGQEIRNIVNVFFKPAKYKNMEEEVQSNIAAEEESRYNK